MTYKIAGIEVHKKVLMVVVMDASTPESKPNGDDSQPCRVTCADC
jgi:hypothetical protein